MIKTTEKQLASAFERWLREYKRNPSKFAKEFGKAASYGKACASHLKQLLAMACIAVAVVVQSGCATPGSVANAPGGATNVVSQPRDTAGNILEVAWFAAAIKHLKDNPEDRAKLEDAAARLGGIASADLFSALIANLGRVGDDDAQLALATGLLFYELELGQLPPLQQPAYVSRVSQRVRSAIERALIAVPPPRKQSYHWSWFHRNV